MSFFEGFRRLLANSLPKPQLRPDTSGGARRQVDRIILFGRHPNPTADYYFKARFAAANMPEYQLADIHDGDFRQLNPDGAFVILCRYASAPVLDWIETNEGQLAGVGLFLDDYIPAVIASKESSFRYKKSLFTNGLRPLRRLNRQLDIVWASTPRLAQNLAKAHPRILPPAPPRSFWDVRQRVSSSSGQTVRIAYHATAIHVAEHYFLKPIIRDILTARPETCFEVFADKQTTRLWQGMEGVEIRKPVSWPSYLEEGAHRDIDIMLVPLSSSLINDCRSATKRIDVARWRAAGIFSISEAYGVPDESGEVRLPYDRDDWRRMILSMIDDPQKRLSAANATRILVSKMSQEAEKGLYLGASSGYDN